MHPYVDCNIIYNGQGMEAAQMSIGRWMDKEDVIDICNGILHSDEEEWNFAICDNMDGPRAYVMNEISQARTNTIWFHLHVESKNKTKLNKQNKKSLIETKPKGMVTRREWVGEWVKRGRRI